MSRYLRARYVRHRHFNRLRHSTAFKGFLAEQATRLDMEEEAVFNLMKDQGYSADDIRNLSEDPTPAAPENTAVPTITGTARVGVQLTASPGTWTGNPAPTFTYQWQRGTTDISGATSDTYTPIAADAGQTLRVVVTGTNSEGNATANSANTAAVQQVPANTAAPVASGTPTVGEVLSVTNGTWTGSPAPTFTYQWQRGTTNISGATANTYTLVADDVDANIRCVVTGTNAAGNASANSNAIGPVVAAG